MMVGTNSKRLRVIMAEHRLTAEDVAAMVGRKLSVVYQWRRDYRRMPDDLLLVLERSVAPANDGQGVA